MLSVQSPGCAGMERLGAPGGPGGGGGGGADRQRQRREFDDLSMAALVELQLRARAEVCTPRGVHTSEALNCPHRIALPDGEHGQDRHLQLRVPYQQSELTRPAIQAPPNKSVRDLPNWAEMAPPALSVRKAASPHKKDGLMQKAVKYLVKFSGSGGAAGKALEAEAPPEPRRAPCVMVPLRPPPAPAPPAPAPSPPPAPPS